MPVLDKSLQEVAHRHGVDLDRVKPRSTAERLQALKSTLSRTDVPFPIHPRRAEACYRQAQAGNPFGIGSLSDESVQLDEFANWQRYDHYSTTDHLSWACLVADQQATKHRYACKEYLAGEAMFEIGGAVIPDFYLLNARIYQQTGWQLATVNMIIPAEVFFACHSRKFFPVTTFMRPLEQDYLQEPDIGHDVAGHVATFTIPAVAEVMNNHGLAHDVIHRDKQEKLKRARDQQQAQQIQAEATELLTLAGRLYWFTVEFGLVMQDRELKAFGAGILSSPGETSYSVDSADSNRILIDPSDDRDLMRLATTDYLISEYQKTYFVMESFELLRSLTPQRILDVTRRARQMLHSTWRELVPGDRVLNVGTVAMSPNEKYYRLLANQPLDDCLRRTAIRNLDMLSEGRAPELSQSQFLRAPLPKIPNDLINTFAAARKQGQFADVPK